MGKVFYELSETQKKKKQRRKREAVPEEGRSTGIVDQGKKQREKWGEAKTKRLGGRGQGMSPFWELVGVFRKENTGKKVKKSASLARWGNKKKKRQEGEEGKEEGKKSASFHDNTN